MQINCANQLSGGASCVLNVLSHIPQICDCKWIFFEILSVIYIFIQERSQRNIIFPILLKELGKVGHYINIKLTHYLIN